MRVVVSIQRQGPSLPAIAKQELFALTQAMNRSIEQGQAAERNVVATNFVDRQRGFLARLIKIGSGDRATRARPVARLRIIGPEGAEDRGQLLARHEDGGSRTANGVGFSDDPSVRIGNYFYLPTSNLRPSFSSVVPRSLYPSSLHITARRDVVGTQPAHVHRTARGVLQLKGDDRTFVLTDNTGQPIGIFQRVGSHGKLGRKGRSSGRKGVFVVGVGSVVRDDIRAIWLFHRSIVLKPRLHFYQVVPQSIQETLVENFYSFLPGALASAK